MKKKNSRKNVILSLSLILLLVVGFGGYFISQYVNTEFNDKKVKNNKALWVGCPLTVVDSSNVEYPVRLFVTINNTSTSYSNSWESSSYDFIQDDNYEGMGFINLTSVFSNYSNKQDVDVFCNSSDLNFIKVQTVWLGPNEIVSKSKYVNDSGLWFFNVASENGGDIEFSHSY
ncbi:MAG: hypothetical protein WCS51_03985, partial [Bacilli bacterium]